MTQTRIAGKFYPLKTSELVNIFHSLTKSQMGVLLYIRSVDPYSNGIRLKTSKIAEILDITKRAVNAAITVLQEKGYLILEDIEYSIKVNAGGYHCDTFSTGTEVGNSVPTQEQDFSPENRNSHSGNSVPTREENFPPENRISHPEPETVAEQEFENPKTLKSSQDIEDTTDKKVGVKEIFEKYYERLRLYGMYKEVWDGEKLVINQKMVEIQKAVFHVPLQKIEAGLRAFCAWMREAKGVRNKYKALETSILRGWEI